MASINVGDWKKGLKLEYNGDPYEILEVNFVKPGKGQAIYTTKMRNLLKGTIITNKYRSGDSLEGADVRKGPAQFSFRDGSNYVFMDVASYEQHPLPVESVEERMRFLKEGDTVDLLFWNERPIDMTPPSQVQLAVTYTEPAARGNTTSNVTKAATVETGAEVQVPAFIEEGNVIKIDTESGTYIERVST
ncbi:elongation factor P [Alienimonas californiensis]|uniref:Elongation factor P n=1 Tax=Alienimonas californiensis TaxID=2527989 RepID=A0A517P631_9PLAN|nr:elongation factor P [Alienimonas californiensis]QDT14827.1 Elongation factor P [Alienimonas californiensis]